MFPNLNSGVVWVMGRGGTPKFYDSCNPIHPFFKKSLSVFPMLEALCYYISLAMEALLPLALYLA